MPKLILLILLAQSCSIEAAIALVEKENGVASSQTTRKPPQQEDLEHSIDSNSSPSEIKQEETGNTETQAPTHSKEAIDIPEPKKNIERYEIEGYADSKRVRIIIDVDDNKEVVGNLFNHKGGRTYVHGEYVDGVLNLYDAKGENYRILMAD